MTIARLQKACDRLVAAKPGYDQGQRRTFYDKKTLKLLGGGEVDCSIGCAWIAAAGGYPVDLSDPMFSGNFVSRLTATGLFEAHAFKSLSQVKPGDFLRGPGHVVFVRDARRWWSAEHDERGKSSGGKSGQQPGEKVGYRAPYLRSAGWTHIVRLVSPKVLLRRALGEFRTTGEIPTKPLELLYIRAPWDGPRWGGFFVLWQQWNRGVALAFTPTPAPGRHAYVVLGSALTKAGDPTATYVARLKLAAKAAQANPASVILLTGGAPRAGVTEAAAGRAWLVTNRGLDPARIVVEEKSSSTVGNARYSVPILRKLGVTSYTLVSHASHLRRAAVLFLARRTQLETVENKVIDLYLSELMAVDDYSPEPVKPALPITADSRHTIADEVRALLNL